MSGSSSMVLLLLFCAGILPSEGRYHAVGIDVSCHSGAIHWPEVKKANFHFVIIKATEGVDLKDPAFDDHWSQLKRLGFRRGAYHFYVTEDDPLQQADFFIRNVNLEKGDLAPVVDIERIGHGTKGGLYSRLKQFLRKLENHYGSKPVIYTSPRFWNSHFKRQLEGYPLWIAEYGVEEPQLPEGWASWHLWQWKENARIKGVEKGADLSYINPAHIDLREITISDH